MRLVEADSAVRVCVVVPFLAACHPADSVPDCPFGPLPVDG